MNLSKRQEKIQAKRKQTPWRDFVMEICSWYSINFYRNSGFISILPNTDRIGILYDERSQIYESYVCDYKNSFFDSYTKLFLNSKISYKIEAGVNENCSFSSSVAGSKNCYLSFTCVNVSDVAYSISVKDGSSNVYNSLMVRDNCENIYDSSGILSSYNVFYSKYISDSNNIWFSDNMIGCTECIGCNNLANKSYCINNIEYSKENYLKNKIHYIQSAVYKSQISFTTARDISSTNIKGGNFNVKSHDISNGFFTYQVNKGNNLILVGGKDSDEYMYDVTVAGSPYAIHYYGSINVGNGDHYYLSMNVHGGSNLYYCDYLINCSFCLGCVGLKNKSYCILNKQYTKEEWYEKVDEIFTQMEQDGQLGEFFPATMNPFYFNDTAAYLIGSSPTEGRQGFTKEEVTAKGYLRRDEPIKVDIPDGAKVVNVSELDNYEGRITDGSLTPLSEIRNPQSNNSTWYIDPSILKCIIQDEQGNVYKIVKMEYDFLMKYGLPLPRKHWLDRMKDNFTIN